MFEAELFKMSCNLGFRLKASSSAQGRRGWKSASPLLWAQNHLPDPGPNPFTARLNMGKLTKKNLTSLSQHVYCMTIPQEEFWCFVKLWTLWALCLCDRAVPQKHPDFLSQESSQSPAPFSIMSFVNINNILLTPPDPASCEPVKLSISRMGVVEIVFDIIAHICLFNALLLCSTSLNRFMSKNT